MRFHEEPTAQTDHHAHNVRNDEYGHDPLVAMPSIPQQDPSDNSIKPGRRERVADPARELIRRQRAVEAARPGHRFFCGVEATGAVLRRRYLGTVAARQMVQRRGCVASSSRCDSVLVESF